MSTDVSDEFEALLDYLKRSRGFDFTAYKRTTLMRRVERRMQMVEVEGFSNYLDYLEVHPEEFAELFNTVLINVTGFFRDSQAWESIANEIIPRILAAKGSTDHIRIWSAGCASGEEPYTIAMLFAEALGMEGFRQRVKIYATDVDGEALNQGRVATYSAKDVENVPAALLEKYFEHSNGKLVFNRDLRRGIIFGRNDLIQDAPISRVDLLICRNCLMYMNSEIQARILQRFHFAIVETGFLFMGRAEMLLLHSHLFTPVHVKRRIFSKVPARKNLRERLLGLSNGNGNGNGNGNNNGDGEPAGGLKLREVAFEADPISQILVDCTGIVLMINERARSMFDLSPAYVGRLVQDLDISCKPVELHTWVTQACTERRPITVKDIELLGAKQRYVDMVVQPLIDPSGGLMGIKAAFTDVTRAHQLQESLQQSKQQLETAFEELQTTNEELQSTVEELETTNEELQSTNEEMETMNEELQSTNGELQTMNQELHRRSEELNHVNGFMESIMGGMHCGVVVLDNELNVQVWNSHSEELWGLRVGEIFGKNFVLADIGLPVDELTGYIKECLSGQTNYRQVTVEAVNRRGRQIKCRVTITPRGTNREIRGVILLMEQMDNRE